MTGKADGPRNVDSSGALVHGNRDSGFSLFTGYGLRPSDLLSAKIAIENTASSTKELRLFEVDAFNSFSRGDLTLMVFDEALHSQVYRGDVGGLPGEGLDLGAFAPGERHAYRFAIVLSIDSPNGGQGRSAGAFYEWRGAAAAAGAR